MWGRIYVKPQSDLFADTQRLLFSLLSLSDVSGLPAPADAPCPSLPAGPAAAEEQGEARGSCSCSGVHATLLAREFEGGRSRPGGEAGRGPHLELLSIPALHPGVPGAPSARTLTSFLEGKARVACGPRAGGGSPSTGSAAAFISSSHLRGRKSREQTKCPVPPLATSTTPMSFPA